MILLDSKADTFPCGLIGTPFEVVYKALRIVAADVWAVDPTVYRAGMAWGWYALHRPEGLVGFRDVVAAALVSAFAPLVKDTQTDAELAGYMRQWRDYTPTFGRLQALYALFGATVDIQPITDPESQAVLSVTDTRLAFYVRITEVDFSRPLSLDDAREIALRATPLGSRPYVYYALESRTQVPVAAIPQAPEVFVENWDVATPVAPPVPLGDFILVDSSGNVVYSVESLTEIEFTPTGYFTIDEGNEVIFVEQSPFPVVCIDEGTRTPESVAPDDSFDTGLPYYDSKLYIITTGDGQDETLYGWQAEEGTPAVDNTIYMFGFWYDTNANDWTFEPRGGSDYQWMGITSQDDVTKLSDIGIGVSTTNAAYGPYGCPTDELVNGNYKFVVLGYYDDLAGTTQSQYSDVNNFYMRSMRRDWVYITEIFLTSSISVNVAFYKVRIEAITPELGYFNASGTAEALPSNTAIPLYRDGAQIPYESGRQYRARGLYDGDGNLITDNPAYFSFSKQNGSLYFSQSYTSGVIAKYIAFV